MVYEAMGEAGLGEKDPLSPQLTASQKEEVDLVLEMGGPVIPEEMPEGKTERKKQGAMVDRRKRLFVVGDAMIGWRIFQKGRIGRMEDWK